MTATTGSVGAGAQRTGTQPLIPVQVIMSSPRHAVDTATTAVYGTADGRDQPVHFTAWFDGVSRGNRGSAGTGAYLVVQCGCESRKVWEGRQFLGQATNNMAKHMALAMALRAALHVAEQLPAVTAIDIRGDSQLTIKQVAGEYNVRVAALKPLVSTGQRLFRCFVANVLTFGSRASRVLRNATPTHSTLAAGRPHLRCSG